MNLRYIRTLDEREKGELCIDLLDGFLAPSWQAKNYVAYRTGSKLIGEDHGPVQYKSELFHFWKGTRVYGNEEESLQAEKALEFLKKIVEEEDVNDISFVTGSGGPTPFSEMFVDFLNWIKKDKSNDT